MSHASRVRGLSGVCAEGLCGFAPPYALGVDYSPPYARGVGEARDVQGPAVMWSRTVVTEGSRRQPVRATFWRSCCQNFRPALHVVPLRVGERQYPSHPCAAGPQDTHRFGRGRTCRDDVIDQ
jgi:hypothetical protein